MRVSKIRELWPRKIFKGKSCNYSLSARNIHTQWQRDGSLINGTPEQLWSWPWKDLSSLQSGHWQPRENEEMQQCQERGKFSWRQRVGRKIWNKGFSIERSSPTGRRIHRNMITEQRSEAKQRAAEELSELWLGKQREEALRLEWQVKRIQLREIMSAAEGHTYALNKYHLGILLGNREMEREFKKGETLFGLNFRKINLATQDRMNWWGKAPRRDVHLNAVFWAREH